eukprot:3387958-Amphidinium_carterae.2
MGFVAIYELIGQLNKLGQKKGIVRQLRMSRRTSLELAQRLTSGWGAKYLFAEIVINERRQQLSVSMFYQIIECHTTRTEQDVTMSSTTRSITILFTEFEGDLAQPLQHHRQLQGHAMKGGAYDKAVDGRES